MSRPVLPDPPDKFSSYESWMKLSDAALSRWRLLWLGRDRVLSNLDSAIAFHEREHARLTAMYDEERQRYLMAHAKLATATPASEAERESLRVMYRHLQAAVHVHDKLIHDRRKVERKFEAWMDLHRFDGKRREAKRKLSQRRLLMRQERQDALNDRLVLDNMLTSLRERLEECDRRIFERTPQYALTPYRSFRSAGELSEALARFAAASV